MNNFIQRTLSGAVFVLIVMASIWFSPYSFLAVFSVVIGLVLLEFHKITNNQKDINVNRVNAIIAGVTLFACTFLDATETTSLPVFSIYGAFIIVTLVLQLFKKDPNPIANWAFFILGQVFVALPFSLLNYVLLIPIDGIPSFQPILLLTMFVTIWVNDSWAYIFGVSFGKHKMFPRVSPKKSWEGFCGGAAMSLLTGLLAWYVVPKISPDLDLSLWQWFIFAELIVIFGTLGDLMESLLKRTLAIKDSGDVIPGHGGMLDRFDSMLLAAPVVYIFMQIVLR